MDLDPRLRPSSANPRDRLPAMSSAVGGGGLGGSGVSSRSPPQPANAATNSSSSSPRGHQYGSLHRERDSLNTRPPLPSPAHHDGVSNGSHSPDSRRHPSHQPDHEDEHGNNASGAASGQDGSDPKRSRACEACRGLKVRCEPDLEDEQAPCKRCRKAGRRCVVTAPSRKRQKKTDSRVSELEKKIDALTASLQARGATAGPLPGHGVHPHSADTSPSGGEGHDGVVSPTAVVMPPRQRSSIEEPRGRERSQGSMGSMGSMAPPDKGTGTSSTPPTRRDPPAFQPPMVMAGMKRKGSDRRANDDERSKASPKPAGMGSAPASSPWVRPDQGDIVDRGIVSMDLAADLFVRYTERMAPHLPAVIFPPSTTAAQLRRSKPILFLAVVGSACSEVPSLHGTLQRELMTIFAEKVFLSGDKSLELVQALLVATIWYWPPEHFEELKFYQLVHVAAVMAIDIGLGKKTPTRKPTTGNAAPGNGGGGPNQLNWNAGNGPFRRHQSPPDPTTIESRRTWLGCYFLTANTSISLHRPNLVRWTPFMAESLELLQLSPDAAPTDAYFCHMVKQHQLGEEIGCQFSLDDAANVVDMNDPRTQYALKAFERDLDRAKSAVAEDEMRACMKIGYSMINLYLHEVALHTKTAPEQLRPPFNTEWFKDGVVGASEPLSAAHISAISACLSAIDGIFTTFLALEPAEIRTLPVYNFVRVAYGVVTLVRMYFSASSPGSELGKVMDQGSLKVEHYLDALIEKFRQTSTDDRSRPAAKFLVVLAMLKSWFIKQGQPDGKGANPSSQQQPGQQQQNQQKQQQQQGARQSQANNTPLHLLSEVAAGTDTSGVRGGFGSVTGLRQPHQPFFHHDAATPSSNASSDMHNQGNTNGHLPSFSDPSVSWTAASAGAAGSGTGSSGGMGGMDMNLGAPTMGLDFANTLGFVPDSTEDGARIMLAEPWFNDVIQGFQGLQDPNTMFPF